MVFLFISQFIERHNRHNGHQDDHLIPLIIGKGAPGVGKGKITNQFSCLVAACLQKLIQIKSIGTCVVLSTEFDWGPIVMQAAVAYRQIEPSCDCVGAG